MRYPDEGTGVPVGQPMRVATLPTNNGIPDGIISLPEAQKSLPR